MISTKGRYALRVMIDLASQNTEDYIALKDIAERQNVSKKYLEIITKTLVTGKMITGISGKGGGYRLTRKPEEYSVGEILELMEGNLATVACLADPEYVCDRKDSCKTLPLWSEYNELVHNFFFQKHLSDLL